MEELLKKLTDEELEYVINERFQLLEEQERRVKEKNEKLEKYPLGTCLLEAFNNKSFGLFKITNITSYGYKCSVINLEENGYMSIDLDDTYSFDSFGQDSMEINKETFNCVEEIVSELIARQEEEQKETYKTIVNNFLILK